MRQEVSGAAEDGKVLLGGVPTASVSASSRTCDYDDKPAIGRVRWTVYGGAYKYRSVCAEHRERVRGQRGIDFLSDRAAAAIPDAPR